MSRSYRRLLAAAFLIAGASGAFAQSASCNITYTWPTWVGGNGFGASIDIRNTGAAITNGWSLVFNFPNGQQLQNGWPVTVSQSGTTVTAASNDGICDSATSRLSVSIGGSISSRGRYPMRTTRTLLAPRSR